MKNPIINNYKNGFIYRTHNRRMSVLEYPKEANVMHVKLENFIGSDHVTALVFNKRGIATVEFTISEEALQAICQGYMEYLKTKL